MAAVTRSTSPATQRNSTAMVRSQRHTQTSSSWSHSTDRTTATSVMTTLHTPMVSVASAPQPRRRCDMSPDRKEGLRLLLFVTFFVSLCLWALGCSLVTQKHADVIVVPPMDDMLAFTMCNGNKPLIVIRQGLSQESIPTVLQHEEIHVSQMRRYPSCHEFSRLYQASADFRLKTELEAYCPEARAVSLISEKDSVVRYLSAHLIRTTGSKQELSTVEKLVMGCLD